MGVAAVAFGPQLRILLAVFTTLCVLTPIKSLSPAHAPELIEFIASGSGPKFADLRVRAPVVYLPTVDQRTFHRSSDGEESGKMDLLGGYWV
jgi:hypothetical protein